MPDRTYGTCLSGFSGVLVVGFGQIWGESMRVSWKLVCYYACLVCLIGALESEWVSKLRAGAAVRITAQSVSAGQARQPQTEEKVKGLIAAAGTFSLWGFILAAVGTLLWILWLRKWKGDLTRSSRTRTMGILPLGILILYGLWFLVMV